ncbi:TIGR02556 family CRISPR-associated protein [Rufibacter sp. XAAS-G3-1]|uniref:TIGR02556 family CRISPR-associated protein n=1 Tax=Rufibacter sp. XAAS-G3-1 TaxID=2729134 RepID=UPI0015E75A57|nr:TIGR02556 family CRISPR-associated protein [Rufibacter sp. XAAS-G3-1]
MQDKAISQIGELEQKIAVDKEPYQLFIENMFPKKGNYGMAIIVFCISKEGDSDVCRYKGIDLEKVNKANFLKFAYRKGSARGGDITFTTKLNEVETKINTIKDIQLKKLIKKLGEANYKEEKALFKAFQVCFEENKNFIKEELSNTYNTLSKDEKLATGLSIIIEIDGEKKYLADFNIIKDILLISGSQDKSEKYSVKSEGKNNLCSICYQIKNTLHGFASPFKYATVDKPGMVSGFFEQKNNWKNYPICTDCSLKFELGKTFITNNLNSNFYGKSYYIIPKTILSTDTNALDKAIKMLLSHKFESASKGSQIKRSEERFGELIANEKNFFNLNLLFYEEDPKNKAIKIKLLLEEILPSRFRKLYVDIPAIVNSSPLYLKAFIIKKEAHDLRFSFGILKTFFEEDFYNLIQKVFLGQPLSKEVLFNKFMQVIRQNYSKIQSSDGYVENTYLTILKAHLTLKYFQHLGIISFNDKYIFMEKDNTEVKEKKESFDLEKLKAFIVQNKGFLDENYKVGVFAVGIMVRLLLNIQNRSLSNTPFEKKLRGYNLSADLLKSIYIETLSKLSQYQGFYAYGNLREFVDEYFILNSHLLNKISNNELSFYFVAGLEFGNKFKSKKELETSENI